MKFSRQQQIWLRKKIVLICCCHKFSFYWVLCFSSFLEGKDSFWCQDWKRANDDNNNNNSGNSNNNNNNIYDTSSKNFCWRHFYDFFYLLSAPFFLVNLMSQIDDMCTALGVNFTNNLRAAFLCKSFRQLSCAVKKYDHELQVHKGYA